MFPKPWSRLDFCSPSSAPHGFHFNLMVSNPHWAFSVLAACLRFSRLPSLPATPLPGITTTAVLSVSENGILWIPSHPVPLSQDTHPVDQPSSLPISHFSISTSFFSNSI